jgi:putative transposase
MSNLPHSDLPQRQNPSPGVQVHLGQSNFVLLTVTTAKRSPWLAHETAHRLLHETWSEATAWLVGDYLLMPDHLHAFCAPRELNFTIEQWIAYWKRVFTLKHKRLVRSLAPPGGEKRLVGSLAPPGEGKRLAGTLAPPEWKFQSRGWHHRLRDGENYSAKWLYVQENPVRKGLVPRIEDWPFKGKVFDLVWTGK